MYTINKLISFFILLQFLNGCTTEKEAYYSYKTDTYTIDTIKHFFYSDNLISYGDFLFEFRKRTNINKVVHGENNPITSIDYDTIGVYLLSGKNKIYYEFDTFALETKIVKIGKFVDKQYGQKLNPITTVSSPDVSFTTPKKIAINNIDCYISEVISNNKTEGDTISQKMLLIRNEKFNSLYKINGLNFSDNNYCIIGFNINNLKSKESYIQEIVSMRPLTVVEKNICEKMVATSKLCVVDTIKGIIRKDKEP